MTIEGIQRIVDATGIEMRSNAKALRDDLGFADTWYKVATEYRSEKARRLRNKNLSTVSKLAKRLNLLLEASDTWEQLAPHCNPRSGSPRIAVQQIIHAAEAALKPKPEPSALDVQAGIRLADELGIGRLSPFEWLAGEHLREIFEKHFARKASARLSDGSCNTPYIRFVVAALAELDISNNGRAYAPETIARATSQAKKPRRRKH